MYFQKEDRKIQSLVPASGFSNISLIRRQGSTKRNVFHG